MLTARSCEANRRVSQHSLAFCSIPTRALWDAASCRPGRTGDRRGRLGWPPPTLLRRGPALGDQHRKSTAGGRREHQNPKSPAAVTGRKIKQLSPAQKLEMEKKATGSVCKVQH